MALIENPTIALNLDKNFFGRSEMLNQLNDVYDAYNNPIDERQRKQISRRAYAFLYQIPGKFDEMTPAQRKDWEKWQSETIEKYCDMMAAYKKVLANYQKALDSHQTVYVPNTNEYTRIWEKAGSLEEKRQITDDYMKTIEHVFNLNKDITRQK